MSLKNKEFYERLLVAKAISEVIGNTITEAFQFVQEKEDVKTTDFVWLKIAGNQITWGDHLLYIIIEILDDIKLKQPGYEPFSVTQETLDSDYEYSKWYNEEWKPYLEDLLLKYVDMYAPRLSMKMERGNKNWLQMIEDKYNIKIVYSDDEIAKLKTEHPVLEDIDDKYEIIKLMRTLL